MPSTPTTSDKAAHINNIAITKANCMTASLYLLRNHRVNLGTIYTIDTQYKANFNVNRVQKAGPESLLKEATIAAKIIRESIREIILDATLSVTLGLR